MNDNLISLNDRTESERREIARKGGKASGEARRERKAIRDGIIERMSAEDFDEIIDGMIERAKLTDRGATVLRDTLGEKPSNNVNLNPPNLDKSIEALEAYIEAKDKESEEKALADLEAAHRGE